MLALGGVKRNTVIMIYELHDFVVEDAYRVYSKIQLISKKEKKINICLYC